LEENRCNLQLALQLAIVPAMILALLRDFSRSHILREFKQLVNGSSVGP
jgi:hypothetical protein